MSKKSLPNNYVNGFIALIIANTIWAAAGPIIKLTVESIPPFTFLFLRFLIVGVVLLPYAFMELSRHKINPRDYWKIAVLGVFAQSSIILVVMGLKYTTAIDSAIIGVVGTMLSMAAGHYFFNEKMHKGVTVGLAITFLGTFFIILEPLFSKNTQTSIPTAMRIWGNILVFFYNLSFLLYIVWSKISFGQPQGILRKAMSFVHLRPMTTEYPSTLLTTISMYVGLLSMLPFAILEYFGAFGTYNFDLLTLNRSAFVGLLYMSLFSSICAYFLFEWALTKVLVADTALLGYMSSLLGMPFAYWILGEIPTKANIIGGLFIAVGVAISELSAHHIRKKKHFIL